MPDKNQMMIDDCPNDAVILDIGANHGKYTTRMAKFPGRKVYAFEPSPQNIEKLKNVVGSCNNVEICEVALSNKNGIAKLMIVNNPGGHSIHKPLDGKKWKHKLENSIDVKTITSDDWVKENNINRIDGIKIDVEAHEVEVVEGGMETLKKFKPIIALETHGTVDVDKLKRLLIECDYGVHENLKINSSYLIGSK